MAKREKGVRASAKESAREEPGPVGRRSKRLRLRIAWMYYVEEMTQHEIAETLGIGRVTVVRLLSDARALHEVKISLSRDVAELPRLEFALQKAFGLKEAIVAPLSSPDADPTAVIGAATGPFISSLMRADMKIGVGWGRTLIRSLASIDEQPLANVSVISLLGGLTKAKQYNPSEFAWLFSRLFQAECHLIAAPALVDAPETKRALVEHCGLDELFELAGTMDAVLLSVGPVTPDGTPYRLGLISEEDRLGLAASGAVGDVLYNYFDIDGRLIDHPINQRVMSAPVETMQAAPVRILTSGGPTKVDTIIGAMRLLKPTVFITDEITAANVLARAGHAV
ncbi:sugar-binding transcriptional regulator [Terrarubrum flagellatum]|uniref:sugar-binding transcriptional regulator n=1 Tax=Terrirubrum flagellatum TaxID=2895980 RepID=UPI0031456BDF